MQLTHFDRWLREKFVYQTHIYTLSLPEFIPKGIRAAKNPNTAGIRYNHLFVASNRKSENAFIRQLKENNQMYTTRIVDRNAWYVPLIAPAQKSPSWRLISLLVISTGLFFLLIYLKSLVEDPEFRKNFLEALEIMKR
jgi:hypothetical protein